MFTPPPPPYPLEGADVRRLRAIMKGISFEQSKHFRQRPFSSCLRNHSPRSTKCTCSIITCVKRNRDLEPLIQLFKRIGTQGLFHLWYKIQSKVFNTTGSWTPLRTKLLQYIMCFTDNHNNNLFATVEVLRQLCNKASALVYYVTVNEGLATDLSLQKLWTFTKRSIYDHQEHISQV